MSDRREFFKQAAGLVALAALAKLPVSPSEPVAAPVVALPAVPPLPTAVTAYPGRKVGEFAVFGRVVRYSMPGVR